MSKLRDLTCVPLPGRHAAARTPTRPRRCSRNCSPGWRIAEDGKSLRRAYRFANFHQTIGFVNAVAWIANAEDHHPDLEVGYDYCRITLATHSIGGLSRERFHLRGEDRRAGRLTHGGGRARSHDRDTARLRPGGTNGREHAGHRRRRGAAVRRALQDAPAPRAARVAAARLARHVGRAAAEPHLRRDRRRAQPRARDDRRGVRRLFRAAGPRVGLHPDRAGARRRHLRHQPAARARRAALAAPLPVGGAARIRQPDGVRADADGRVPGLGPRRVRRARVLPDGRAARLARLPGRSSASAARSARSSPPSCSRPPRSRCRCWWTARSTASRRW